MDAVAARWRKRRYRAAEDRLNSHGTQCGALQMGESMVQNGDRLLSGELTLDMLIPGNPPTSFSGETTRTFEQMEPRHVAELLAAATAAAFFDRPEPAINAESGTCLWRVRIMHQGCSRELVIPDRNAGPELDRVAKAARACVRDRQVFALSSMSEAERERFVAELRGAEHAHELAAG